MTNIKFTLKCPVCGSTKFQAASATPGPDDPLTCSACGKKIYLGKEKERLETEARRAVEERLRSQP
jgi:predicted  nucleic acid-binding Zn-ribbon protein